MDHQQLSLREAEGEESRATAQALNPRLRAQVRSGHVGFVVDEKAHG
jgi:hypothetical protein